MYGSPLLRCVAAARNVTIGSAALPVAPGDRDHGAARRTDAVRRRARRDRRDDVAIGLDHVGRAASGSSRSPTSGRRGASDRIDRSGSRCRATASPASCRLTCVSCSGAWSAVTMSFAVPPAEIVTVATDAHLRHVAVGDRRRRRARRADRVVGVPPCNESVSVFFGFTTSIDTRGDETDTEVVFVGKGHRSSAASRCRCSSPSRSSRG